VSAPSPVTIGLSNGAGSASMTANYSGGVQFTATTGGISKAATTRINPTQFLWSVTMLAYGPWGDSRQLYAEYNYSFLDQAFHGLRRVTTGGG
jgi:hypothetical protein